MAKVHAKLTDITPQEIERFWSYVNRGDASSCWGWTKCRMDNGYGAFTFQRWTFKTHRIAYYLHYGVDPSEMLVCHRCDRPSCCNPAHLFLGTPDDNLKDCKAKGRTASGERHMSRTTPNRLAKGNRHGHAKVNPDVVREVRKRYATGKETQQTIADSLGLRQDHISSIVRGRTWRHVT